MNRPAENEEIKQILLVDINKHREKHGRKPLLTYPDKGCCHCGEEQESVGSLIQCRNPFRHICRQCLLERSPYKKLNLPEGEHIAFFGNNPTFHRSTNYAILLTDQALYLYAPLFITFARWKRFALKDIIGVQFRDSKIFPALLINHTKGIATLRTPLDYAGEMEHDRKILKESADRILDVIRITGANDK